MVGGRGKWEVDGAGRGVGEPVRGDGAGERIERGAEEIGVDRTHVEVSRHRVDRPDVARVSGGGIAKDEVGATLGDLRGEVDGRRPRTPAGYLRVPIPATRHVGARRHRRAAAARAGRARLAGRAVAAVLARAAVSCGRADRRVAGAGPARFHLAGGIAAVPVRRIAVVARATGGDDDADPVGRIPGECDHDATVEQVAARHDPPEHVGPVRARRVDLVARERTGRAERPGERVTGEAEGQRAPRLRHLHELDVAARLEAPLPREIERAGRGGRQDEEPGHDDGVSGDAHGISFAR